MWKEGRRFVGEYSCEVSPHANTDKLYFSTFSHEECLALGSPSHQKVKSIEGTIIPFVPWLDSQPPSATFLI